MELGTLLTSFLPSWSSAGILFSYLAYLALAGAVLPGKNVPGAVLPDGTRLHYRSNGLLSLFLLMALLGIGISMKSVSPMVIADKGPELLLVTFIFCVIVTLLLYITGCKSRDKSSSLKKHVTGNFIHDWWFGVQLNPHFMGIDLKFFFVRAGMMGWLFINLSLFSKSIHDGTANLSVILYQLFCALYVVDYFFHEEFMTSTWDIIAENLGFMLVFGDLVFIPFTFTIQNGPMVLVMGVSVPVVMASRAINLISFLSHLSESFNDHVLDMNIKGKLFVVDEKGWWLLRNKVELPKVVVLIDCLVFLIGYQIFRGANKQKHVFKKDPKVSIWGKPPKVIGGKLLASGYWGLSRHCNYLGDLLLALSFSLPCGASSAIPYFYPVYLFILLIWRERRDDARCSEKYKDIWAEYCKHVPWRILPYVY